MAVGTSLKSCQLNTHHFLIPGMQTALAWGGKAVLTSYLPLFPSRAWQGLPLAGLRAACSPGLAESLHLPYFIGQGGWQCARARLTSAAVWERERAESPERLVALWAENR